jgi:hypothetical protein
MDDAKLAGAGPWSLTVQVPLDEDSTRGVPVAVGDRRGTPVTQGSR